MSASPIFELFDPEGDKVHLTGTALGQVMVRVAMSNRDGGESDWLSAGPFRADALHRGLDLIVSRAVRDAADMDDLDTGELAKQIADQVEKAEATVERWKRRHAYVDEHWESAEREVTELRGQLGTAIRERDEWEANAEAAERRADEAERERTATAQDRDELIAVQAQIVKHPAFKPCFDGDGKLLPRMLDRLDGLMEAEQGKSQALDHSATAPHVTVMRDRDPNYLNIRVDHPIFGKYGVREHIPNTRDDVAEDMWVSFSSEEVLIEHPLIGRHARPLDIPISDEMVRRARNAYAYRTSRATSDWMPEVLKAALTTSSRPVGAEQLDETIDAAIRGHDDITSPALVHAIADALAEEGVRAPEVEA